MWDFEYKLRQSSSVRRPDLTFEDKETKKIWICEMACPQENNIEARVKEKLDEYQQQAFEKRENRFRYRDEVFPLVFGSLGGGAGKLWKNVQNVIETETETENTVKLTQKTVPMQGAVRSGATGMENWNSDYISHVHYRINRLIPFDSLN